VKIPPDSYGLAQKETGFIGSIRKPVALLLTLEPPGVLAVMEATSSMRLFLILQDICGWEHTGGDSTNLISAQ
jgi:hypothetical protein